MKKLITILLFVPMLASAQRIVDLSYIGGSAGPTIVPSGTLTFFTNQLGIAASSQSFTFVGSRLTASVVWTAGSGMEVSTDNVTFGATATYTQSSGSASGTVYVRTAAASAIGFYNSSILGSSAGAPNANVPYSADVYAVAKDSLRVQFDSTSVDQAGWTIMKGSPTYNVKTATGGNNTTLTVSSVSKATTNWNPYVDVCAFPNNGTTTGTVWNYAANVMKESWFTYNASGGNYNATYPQFKVSGLRRDGKTYNLQLTASVSTSISIFQCNAEYRVLGASLLGPTNLNAQPAGVENKTSSITFTVTPDNTGAIYIYMNPAAGQTLASMSAFILKEN